MTEPRKAVFAIPGDVNTVTGGYRYEKRLLEELRASGRDVVHLELPDSFPTPSEQDMAGSVAALVDICPSTPIILDGFVSGGIDPIGLARVTAPTVAVVHHPLAMETGLDRDLRAHLFVTERSNLELVHHVLVPSPHTARVLVSDYNVPPDKITVAIPGTDRPKQPRRDSEPPLILAVGLHHPRKGHAILMRALAEIEDLSWRAVIVGRIQDRSSFEDLLALRAQLGLEARVEVHGQLSDAALEDHWSEACIFALASEYEGYGMVFAEALVRGLPIVACKGGAIPDTVPESAGLLVPPHAPKAFADALRTLLTTPSVWKEKAHGARNAGAELPEWKDTGRIAEQVLDKISQT
ncbi:MAG: glycosyltransferase family 4 protein [Dinoroseobacter sp.]|nr:glycosyltransferase family 4 protein [Dinoroseobacter sp.]